MNDIRFLFHNYGETADSIGLQNFTNINHIRIVDVFRSHIGFGYDYYDGDAERDCDTFFMRRQDEK